MITLNLKNVSTTGLLHFATTTLPLIATFGLVVVLMSTLAMITWKAMPTADDEVAPAVVVKAQNFRSSTQASSNNVHKQIPNWHLFGRVQNKPTVKPVAQSPITTQEAPDTKLRLMLKGVVASKNMMNAWAIIADRSGKDDSYGIDASLPGGATLKEIYADRIILLHNGRLETLRLPKTGIVDSRNKRPSRRSASKNSRNHKTSVTRNRSNVTRVSSAGSEILKGYRDKLMTDPQSVMNTVRAEPYRQGGRLKGYRIFPGRDKGLFGQLGLEPGDVVISVNGISLDSPLKGLEVMQNITDASEVSVDVLRNGVSQTFVVPMN